MPKLNQRGVAHIFLILFLIVGLAVAVYLVKQKTNILPKAYEVPTSPSSGCYARLGRFSVDKVCAEVQNGFRSANFDCLALAGSVSDSSNQAPAHSIGTPETCKLTEDWLKEANDTCQSICQDINLTPTPSAGTPGDGKTCSDSTIQSARNALGALGGSWASASCQQIKDKIASDPTIFVGDDPIRKAFSQCTCSSLTPPAPPILPTREPSTPSATPFPLLKPEAPTSVVQSCYPNGFGAMLTWESPYKEFVIRIQDLTSPNYPVQEINATGSSYKLTIKPNFEYRWNVYAIKAGSRSDSSEYKTFSCKGATQ